MEKIYKEKMAEISGGAKCIYHGIGAFFGLVGVILNASAVIDCWNNVHVEN